MLEAMYQGLMMLLVPYKLLMLLIGLLVGGAVGIIPGVGGSVAIAIVLPFLMKLDPVSAVAMLMGIMGVINTSDSITAILLAIPGTAGGAASIVEGSALARKGEASRALSAAFFASLVGGIFGALGLGLSIPILGILIKQFGSPEFLMLSILGISAVSGLGGAQLRKGLMSAALGLMLSAVGGAALTPYFRYTLGLPYLYDGMPLIIVALGIFGIPEMIDLTIRGLPIGGQKAVMGWEGVRQGIKDVLQNGWLVFRCCLIGLYVGIAPGAGASVASWLAYAHSVQSSKNKDLFGKGDIRGLIAPECANNACRGGDLLTTLLFGVPGSTSCALILMALIMFGVFPGPDMVGKNLALTWSFVWGLALSTVIGVILCLLLANHLAKITAVRITTLAPLVIVIIIIGAFQATQSWWDLILLAVLGILGWVMKETGYGRPPLIVGFVLGTLCERYLGLSIQRYGMTWLWRPWVIFLLICTFAALWVGVKWEKKGKEIEEEQL